jgi:hypothetical protein
MRIWMLSQFYHCPEHSKNLGVLQPVCNAYGYNYHNVIAGKTEDEWQLVEIFTTVGQLEAAKKDPRVVICGKDYNKPPAKLLEVYKDWLDPSETYMFMGQVIARLAEKVPAFHHQWWKYE